MYTYISVQSGKGSLNWTTTVTALRGLSLNAAGLGAAGRTDGRTDGGFSYMLREEFSVNVRALREDMRGLDSNSFAGSVHARMRFLHEAR